ncbi:MAG TPA: hypothetical protein VGD99_20940, partial [Anaerolineae bacterium]
PDRFPKTCQVCKANNNVKQALVTGLNYYPRASFAGQHRQNKVIEAPASAKGYKPPAKQVEAALKRLKRDI